MPSRGWPPVRTDEDLARLAPQCRCIPPLVGVLLGCSDSTSPEPPLGAPGAWVPLAEGITGVVSAALEVEGDLVVTGSFSTAGDQPARRIARWDGTLWHPIGTGIDGPGQALAILDGDLVVAGAFGAETGRVLRWDGSVWSPLGAYSDGGIMRLQVHDGTLYAGGNGLARWDGAAWQPVEVEIDGEAHEANPPFAAFGENFVVGVGSDQLARWDGVAWTWMERPGLSQLWSKGETLYGGYPWVRWTGSGWTAVPALEGQIHAVDALADGSLLVGRTDLSSFRLDRFDGSAWQTVTESLDGPVRGLGSYRGALVVAGEFATINGLPFRGIAAFVPDWSF